MGKIVNGKKFSKEYQPDLKWTEEKALELGNSLILWLRTKEQNIFYEDFLIIENDYYPELISYLSNKYASFLKLIEKAKLIQELKLKKYGVLDKLNATMTKFVLVNNHDWKDKSEIETTNRHSIESPQTLDDWYNENRKKK